MCESAHLVSLICRRSCCCHRVLLHTHLLLSHRLALVGYGNMTVAEVDCVACCFALSTLPPLMMMMVMSSLVSLALKKMRSTHWPSGWMGPHCKDWDKWPRRLASICLWATWRGMRFCCCVDFFSYVLVDSWCGNLLQLLTLPLLLCLLAAQCLHHL